MNYFDNIPLASSDYEGTVIVWDTVTGQKTSVFQVGGPTDTDLAGYRYYVVDPFHFDLEQDPVLKLT